MRVGRRCFLAGLSAAAAVRPIQAASPRRRALTVRGPVDAADLGTTLVHEHVLVDFVGADKVGRHRYDADEAFRTVLPHLLALKERGARTLVECTPAWLGRDPMLLVRLSSASGLHILTNTGYYGAAHGKYLAADALEESAERLAERWTAEWRDGIEGTGVRPGFIKTGVDSGPLSSEGRKLALLHERDVHASALVWVHAQNEKDPALHLRAARAGAWIELDGVAEESKDAHVAAVMDLARAGHLEQVLVSHDAGWYHVGEPAGGLFRPYTFVFDGFLPALRQAGLGEGEVRTLLVANPARLMGLPEQ